MRACKGQQFAPNRRHLALAGVKYWTQHQLPRQLTVHVAREAVLLHGARAELGEAVRDAACGGRAQRGNRRQVPPAWQAELCRCCGDGFTDCRRRCRCCPCTRRSAGRSAGIDALKCNLCGALTADGLGLGVVRLQDLKGVWPQVQNLVAACLRQCSGRDTRSGSQGGRSSWSVHPACWRSVVGRTRYDRLSCCGPTRRPATVRALPFPRECQTACLLPGGNAAAKQRNLCGASHGGVKAGRALGGRAAQPACAGGEQRPGSLMHKSPSAGAVGPPHLY